MNVLAHSQLHKNRNLMKYLLNNIFDNLHQSVKLKIILWSSPRFISIGQLRASQRFHPRPINLVVYKETY